MFTLFGQHTGGFSYRRYNAKRLTTFRLLVPSSCGPFGKRGTRLLILLAGPKPLFEYKPDRKQTSGPHDAEEHFNGHLDIGLFIEREKSRFHDLQE